MSKAAWGGVWIALACMPFIHGALLLVNGTEYLWRIPGNTLLWTAGALAGGLLGDFLRTTPPGKG